MEKLILKKMHFMHSAWVYVSIYILTVADIIFTYIGLKQGVIEEANPLMNFFFSRWPNLTLIGVLVSVAIIMHFLYRVRAQVKWLIPTMVFVLTIKLLVVVMHFYWMLLIS